MYKNEMDPASIAENTEGTRFQPKMDEQADRQMDNVKPVYLPCNFNEA